MKPSQSQRSFFSKSINIDTATGKNFTTNAQSNIHSTFYKNEYSSSNFSKSNANFTRKAIKISKFSDSEIPNINSNLKKSHSDFFSFNKSNNFSEKATAVSPPRFFEKNKKKMNFRLKPIKVRNFSVENFGLQKEIIRTVNEKKIFQEALRINEEVNLDSKRSSNYDEDFVENVTHSSKKDLNLKALDVLNQFGHNEIYKDVINFSGQPKESIIDSVYDKLAMKNMNKFSFLRSLKSNLNLAGKEDNYNKRNSVFQRNSTIVNMKNKGNFKNEKIEFHNFMKNQDTWREVNCNISFPSFLKDANLLFKIMEQNSGKLKVNNNLA